MSPDLNLDEKKALVPKNLGVLFGYAIVSVIASNLFIYILPSIFRMTPQQRVKLFKIVKSDNNVLLLKEW
jgi:hypothetical protein